MPLVSCCSMIPLSIFDITCFLLSIPAATWSLLSLAVYRIRAAGGDVEADEVVVNGEEFCLTRAIGDSMVKVPAGYDFRDKEAPQVHPLLLLCWLFLLSCYSLLVHKVSKCMPCPDSADDCCVCTFSLLLYFSTSFCSFSLSALLCSLSLVRFGCSVLNLSRWLPVSQSFLSQSSQMMTILSFWHQTEFGIVWLMKPQCSLCGKGGSNHHLPHLFQISALQFLLEQFLSSKSQRMAVVKLSFSLPHFYLALAK